MSSTGDEYDEGDQDVNQSQNFQSLPETTELDEDRKDGLVSGHDHFIESDDERDGRFHGPDQTWRFYTQEERTLAAVLDQAENNDLSIHLYNAHQWKSQHRRKVYHDHVDSWRNKQSWSDRNEQGKLPFLPNSTWTAWPLMPSDVPRSDEQWGIPIRDTATEVGTLSRVVPWRPSLDLEEVVKGEILRQAKRRYEEREWLSGKSSSPSSSQDSAQVSSSDAGSSEEEDDVEESATVPSPNATPSFLIDEDTAGALTGLTTRHIITKLSDVLNGLHHSRTGHRTVHSRSRSRSRRLASSSHSRCTSPAEAESKRRETETMITCESDEPAPFQDIDVNDEADRGSASKRKTHRHRLGTRDWSEMLGIASLTGWDQNVIDRAARRCTALFGEGMDFRVMSGIMVEPSRDEIVRYVPGMAAVEIRSLESDEELELPIVSGGPGQFPCPHKSCPRHEEPYEKRWRLREHLKRKHYHSNEEPGEVLRGRAQISQPRAASASGKYESFQDTDWLKNQKRE